MSKLAEARGRLSVSNVGLRFDLNMKYSKIKISAFIIALILVGLFLLLSVE